MTVPSPVLYDFKTIYQHLVFWCLKHLKTFKFVDYKINQQMYTQADSVAAQPNSNLHFLLSERKHKAHHIQLTKNN